MHVLKSRPGVTGFVKRVRENIRVAFGIGKDALKLLHGHTKTFKARPHFIHGVPRRFQRGGESFGGKFGGGVHNPTEFLQPDAKRALNVLEGCRGVTGLVERVGECVGVAVCVVQNIVELLRRDAERLETRLHGVHRISGVIQRFRKPFAGIRFWTRFRLAVFFRRGFQMEELRDFIANPFDSVPDFPEKRRDTLPVLLDSNGQSRHSRDDARHNSRDSSRRAQYDRADSRKRDSENHQDFLYDAEAVPEHGDETCHRDTRAAENRRHAAERALKGLPEQRRHVKQTAERPFYQSNQRKDDFQCRNHAEKACDDRSNDALRPLAFRDGGRQAVE